MNAPERRPLFALGHDLDGGRLFSVIAWRGVDGFTITVDDAEACVHLDVSGDELARIADVIGEVRKAVE